MTTPRGALVRRAHQNLDQRPRLLPAIKKTAGGVAVTTKGDIHFSLDPFTGRAYVVSRSGGIWSGTLKGKGSHKLINRNPGLPEEEEPILVDVGLVGSSSFSYKVSGPLGSEVFYLTLK